MRLQLSTVIRSTGIQNRYGKADRIRNLKTKSYEIRDRKDGSKLFVIYDNATNSVIDMWQLAKLFNREDFKTIIEGKSTIKDIVEIDPYTINIEKSKENGATGVSEHKLKNNEILLINYIKKNDVWTVDKTNFLNNDPSDFTKTIIPEDLLLIS